jgi:small subunit ribosomal protein S6
MSEEKKTDMAHYEMLCLISNKYSEDELVPIKEKINKVITDSDGKITGEEDWGKKKLAYPIKKFRHGYYYLLEFDIDKEAVKRVDRLFRMMNEILRHQIVKKRIFSEEEMTKEKELTAKIVAKTKVKEEKEAEAEKAKTIDKDKVELKDLDEKLDKILETEDLL